MSVAERLPVAAEEAERPIFAQLERFLAHAGTRRARLVGPDGEEVELPESLFRVLRDAVHQLRQGNALAIMPVHSELTTQEAADLLNVSRQYLVRLLDRGEIPFTRTGTHRRVRFGDLMAYARRRSERRREDLRELARVSEELSLYDY